MKVQYFSVEDVKAQQFGPLFPARNVDVAKRMFKTLLREVDPDYYGDYWLHPVVEFDDSDGSIDSVFEGPICSGSVFLEVNK